jgi:hypothetical protein
VPSTQTDLFSLAVLLFYMFVMHHPLEGRKELAIKCLDLPAMKKLYGTEPLFIFDPSDDSNALLVLKTFCAFVHFCGQTSKIDL